MSAADPPDGAGAVESGGRSRVRNGATPGAVGVDVPVEVETPTQSPTPSPRARGGRRRVGIVVGVLVLLLVVPIVAVGTWVYLELNPRGGYGNRVVVTLQQGWGTSQIGDELARKGVVGSGLVFRIWERDEQFTAGQYVLRENMGVNDAAAALRPGPSAAPQVGVLPGLTLDEVGDRVAGIRRFTKERFLQAASDGSVRSVFQPAGTTTLRGLLWPDSYPVAADQTEAGLATAMKDAFDAHATKLGLADAAAKLGLTPYQVIIVASLVQREAKLDEDRPLIAAVVYNRLKAGMQLQIDATTQYARKTGDPSYDTYKIAALPPTPISTVGEASLTAAMHPADVPYRYYVLSDANGKHAFAQTYEEHLKNVAAARAKGLL